MKSPFWTYFHDKLNWLPIFRPGPVSALMAGLALHMDEVRQDILWLREQWNPATCELPLLERYGASRGIFRNSFDTDESYRKRVVHAYIWHKMGGKVRGMETIFAESGFDCQVSSSPDRQLWAHFRIRLAVTGLFFGPETFKGCFWLANEFKPARSVLEGIWTYGITNMTHAFAAGSRTLTSARTRLYFPAPEIPATTRVVAAGVRTFTHIRIPFRLPAINPGLRLLAAGIASFTSMKILNGNGRGNFLEKVPSPGPSPSKTFS